MHPQSTSSGITPHGQAELFANRFRRLSLAPAICAAVMTVSYQANAATANWTGGSSNTWNSNLNWDTGVVPSIMEDVVFPAATPVSGNTISLLAGESALSLTFRSNYSLSGGDLTLGLNGKVTVASGTTTTIASILQGFEGLTLAATNGLAGANEQAGGGKMILTGANTFSAPVPATAISIASGILSISANNNLGATTNGLSIDGGTLQSTGTFSMARTVNIGLGGATFDVTGSNVLTVTGIVSGTATSDALIKTGSGTLFLDTAVNTFSGNIVLKGGFIEANDKVATTNPQPTRNLGDAGNDIFFDGGGIRWTAPSSSSGNGRWTVDTSSIWHIGAGGATIDVVNRQSSKIYFRGVDSGGVNDQVQGSGNITKMGLGPLTLENSNPNFSGDWVLENGILEVRGTAALGDGTNAITVNGGELANAVATVAQGGSNTIANGITMNGGALSGQSNNTPTYTGAITFNNSSTIRVGDWWQNVARNINLDGKLSGNGNFTVSMGSFGSGVYISGGSLSTTVNTGTLFIKNNTNDIAGQITINNNIRVNTASSTGSGNTIGMADIVLAGGTLQLRDNGSGNSEVLDYTSNDVMVADNAGGGATLGISTIDVARASANTLNTFRLGDLSIGEHELRITGANGYSVEFAGSTTLTGNATFNVAAVANSFTLSGGVSGAGFGFTKIGVGQLTLNAAATHTGITNVNAGTLALGSSGSIAASTQINVADGASFNVAAPTGGYQVTAGQTLLNNGTLTGSPQVAGKFAGTGFVNGALNIGTGGILGGDNLAGTLAINGALAFGAGSTFSIDITGALPGDGPGFYDQLTVNSFVDTVSIASNAQIVLSLSGFAPQASDRFYLLTRADLASFDTFFANAPQDALVSLGAGLFGTITYTADAGSNSLTGGNDIAIYGVVPEPGTAAVLFLGGTLLAGFRRSRSK